MTQQIRLSLADCRSVYETHFNRDLPGDLSYNEAARQVLDEIGTMDFVVLLEELRTERVEKAPELKRYHVHGTNTLSTGEELAITITVDAASEEQAQRLAWCLCSFDVSEIEEA